MATWNGGIAGSTVVARMTMLDILIGIDKIFGVVTNRGGKSKKPLLHPPPIHPFFGQVNSFGIRLKIGERCRPDNFIYLRRYTS